MIMIITIIMNFFIVFLWGGGGGVVVLYLPAKEKVLAGITMNRMKAWNL